MKRLLAACLLISMAAQAMAQVQSGSAPKVIYGDDDRLDLYQIQIPKLLELADSTVGLFKATDIKLDGEKATLKTEHYGTAYGLCPEEPFFNQHLGAFCSGSLIGPDLLMTAGHCVTSEAACTTTKFVFGFGIKKEGENPTSVDANEVYGCGKLLGRAQVNNGADWALIKLDRPVPNHKPLAFDPTGAVKNDDLLIVIGHPAGLPTKVAGGAKVRDASPQGFYVANLDTYGGNSGSAVFNATTGLINGILVRGEQDYVWKGSCRVSKVCADIACRGEDVTKLSSVQFPGSEMPAPGTPALPTPSMP